ncbi:MAG: hypothetical protein ACK559_06005, partial [bacterium]
MEAHEIDVGIRGHLPAAVAAVGHERRPAPQGIGVRRVGEHRLPDVEHDGVEPLRGQAAGLESRTAGRVLGGEPASQVGHRSRGPHDGRPEARSLDREGNVHG